MSTDNRNPLKQNPHDRAPEPISHRKEHRRESPRGSENQVVTFAVTRHEEFSGRPDFQVGRTDERSKSRGQPVQKTGWFRNGKYHIKGENRNKIAILIISLIIGMGTFAYPAFIKMMKDYLGFSENKLQLMFTVIQSPKLFVPVFGYIMDNYPIYGYRRRSYLILWGFLTVVSIYVFSAGDKLGRASIYLTMFAWETGFAFLAVGVQALTAEMVIEFNETGPKKTEKEKQNYATTLGIYSNGFRLLGNVLMTIPGGLVLDDPYNWTVWMVFFSVATAYIPLIPAGFICYEKPKSRQELEQKIPPRKYLKKICDYLKSPQIKGSLIYILISRARPMLNTSIQYYMIEVLELDYKYIAIFLEVQFIGALLGQLSYKKWFQHWDFKNTFFSLLFLLEIFDLSIYFLLFKWNTTFGLNHKQVLGFYWFFDGYFNYALVYMIGVYLVRLAPKNFEGTVTAISQMIYTLDSSIGGPFGVLILKLLGVTSANYDNLWIAFLIRPFYQLLLLPFGWRSFDSKKALQLSEGLTRQQTTNFMNVHTSDTELVTFQIQRKDSHEGAKGQKDAKRGTHESQRSERQQLQSHREDRRGEHTLDRSHKEDFERNSGRLSQKNDEYNTHEQGPLKHHRDSGSYPPRQDTFTRVKRKYTDEHLDPYNLESASNDSGEIYRSSEKIEVSYSNSKANGSRVTYL